MDLELRTLHVRDVVLGDKNDLTDGVLTVNEEGLKKAILQDSRIVAVKVDLAKPGESCRILPVKDVIEPRAKAEGEIFPGIFDSNVPECGSGITYALKGSAIVTTGPIVGFQEGVIDMSGPCAQYTQYSKNNNIVLHLTKRPDVDQHDHEEVVRFAGLKAANYVGKAALSSKDSYESEMYHWPSVGERINMYPELPKVVYICNIMAQGLLHDTYFYGRDAKEMIPTVVSPTEFFDGAVISGNCVSPGSKTTTYFHENNAVIKALWAKHGTELNFVGIILNPLAVTLKEKERNIMMSVRIATQEFGADAALISQEGFGNPTTDLMHVCQGLEKRGVKTVIITNEDAGLDGMSESLPDVVPEANAIVSTGNSNATILLPPMERTLGELQDIARVTGGTVDSIKPDGSLEIEIHCIMGGHNLQGNTYLSATTI